MNYISFSFHFFHFFCLSLITILLRACMFCLIGILSPLGNACIGCYFWFTSYTGSVGIIAGHLYYFLTVLHPLAGRRNILKTPIWVYPFFFCFLFWNTLFSVSGFDLVDGTWNAVDVKFSCHKLWCPDNRDTLWIWQGHGFYTYKVNGIGYDTTLYVVYFEVSGYDRS